MLLLLKWLRSYLSGRKIRDPDVWRAFRGAWRAHRHPRLYRCLAFPKEIREYAAARVSAARRVLAARLRRITRQNQGFVRANPNPILLPDQRFDAGATTLSWMAPRTSQVEVRVGEPSGPLFSRGAPRNRSVQLSGFANWQNQSKHRMWNSFTRRSASAAPRRRSRSVWATIRCSGTRVNSRTRLESYALHAPLRARSVLGTLADQGRRAEESGNRLIWNWLRWQRLATEGTLEAEWRANSHADGCLDVYGEKRPLVEDLRQRNAVAPWLNGGVPENSRTKHAISSRPGRNLKSRLRLREQAAGFLSDTLRLMDETEGWFTRDEGRLLIMGTVLAFCEQPAHSIVELGSYLGRSSVVLGRVVEEISKGTTVHAIDPHEGDLTEPGDVAASEEPAYERFLENIRRAALEHVVEPIRRRSFDVQWNQPISLLLVDALHDYENVSRDFLHFEEWLLPGSVVAFHDYGETYPGVQRFVDEILQSGRYEIVARIDILILLKKVGDPDAPQRKVMTNTNEEATSERLERQTKGISILQEVLRSELAARVEQVGERDKIIRRQQAEPSRRWESGTKSSAICTPSSRRKLVNAIRSSKTCTISCKPRSANAMRSSESFRVASQAATRRPASPHAVVC